MTKMTWTRPVTEVQQFAANEYVAACGDQNVVYKFVCDAPGGALYCYENGDGVVDGTYTGTGSATLLGSSYNPCAKAHEAPTTDDFYDGYVENKEWVWTGFMQGEYVTTQTPVIVWKGENGNNGHATAALNMNSWETAKS